MKLYLKSKRLGVHEVLIDDEDFELINGKKKSFYEGSYVNISQAISVRDSILETLDLESNLKYRRKDIPIFNNYCQPCFNAVFGIINHAQIRLRK